MSVQIIRTESGDELVVLTRREYLALLARAGDEVAEDEITALLGGEARPRSRAVRRWRCRTTWGRRSSLASVPSRCCASTAA